MAYNNTVTVVGNVVRDPELAYTQSQTAVVRMSVAHNRPPRSDGHKFEPSFFDVSVFGKQAENVAESVRKGARVVVFGSIRQQRWTSQDGQPRTKVEILADEVAPSLRFATADISRNPYTSEASDA